MTAQTSAPGVDPRPEQESNVDALCEAADMKTTEAAMREDESSDWLTDLDRGLIALRNQFTCRLLDPQMAHDARKIAEALADIGAFAVSARQHEIADALEEMAR